MCNRYYIEHFTRPNKPVSDKWNHAFEYLRNIGVSYVLVLGSDDIISTDLLRRIDEKAEQGYDLIGVKSVYFYAGEGIDRGKLVRLDSGQILPASRTIKATVLDKLQDIHQRVQAESDSENLESLATLLSTWLDLYDKIQKLQNFKSTK